MYKIRGLLRNSPRVTPTMLQKTKLSTFIPRQPTFNKAPVKTSQGRTPVKGRSMVLTIKQFRHKAMHLMSHVLRLLIINRVIRHRINMAVIRRRILPTTRATLRRVIHHFRHTFNRTILTQLVRNHNRRVPQINNSTALHGILHRSIRRIARALIIMLIGLIRTCRHLGTAILTSHNNYKVTCLRTNLQPRSANLTHVRTVTNGRPRVSFNTIMMSNIMSLTNLLFNNNRARRREQFRKATRQLALIVPMNLSRRHMNFPTFHPANRPTETRYLRRNCLYNRATLITTLQANRRRLTRPAPAVAIRHVTISSRLRMFKKITSARTLHIATASRHRHFSPPRHRATRQALSILHYRFQSSVVRRDATYTHSSGSLSKSSKV